MTRASTMMQPPKNLLKKKNMNVSLLLSLPVNQFPMTMPRRRKTKRISIRRRPLRRSLLKLLCKNSELNLKDKS